MSRFQKGDRVQLMFMPDDPHPIEGGTYGTVEEDSTTVDLGWPNRKYEQVHVDWDNGRSLGLCCPPDVVRRVMSEEKT